MIRDASSKMPRLSARFARPRVAMAMMALSLLAGCAAGPVPTFDLSAPSGFTARGGGTGQLIVVAPTALAVLDSEKIVVEAAPGQITYLTDAQWSDRLSSLLQARIIQAFENGSKLRRVARPGDGVAGDYQLSTDIRTFGVKVTPEGTFAAVEISAKLIGTAGGRIIAARIFTARVPLSSVSGLTASTGLDQASNQVLIEMVRWASAAQG